MDDASALKPVVHGTRPSEAVLAAESNAKKLLQMPHSWAQRLEQQGLAKLAAPWLACVDETCASFWRNWDKLFETFLNTMDQAGAQDKRADGSMECTYDASLLNECMQLHGMLHDSIPVALAAFQGEVVQLAVRMAASTEPAFSVAIAAKLADPAVWCARLAIPSEKALEAARVTVLGGGGMVGLAGSSGPLPATSAALATAEREARAIVTRCCMQPVNALLAGYPDEAQWTTEPAAAELQGGVLPLKRVTAVGEHLFSLVPQLERSQDSSQFQWLNPILEAVVEATVQQALQIRRLTLRGAEQLTVDLEYVQKVTDALGSSGGAGPAADTSGIDNKPSPLADFLEVLGFLLAQLRRKQECTAKGEAFVEESRDSSAPGRRYERLLRAILGLERPLAV
jgi:hypothetical protein